MGFQAPGNTVGSLQELCVKHGYPMPTYAMGPVGGQPHQRNFAMGNLQCNIFGFTIIIKDAVELNPNLQSLWCFQLVRLKIRTPFM
jgi:hypothetical protein